MGGVFTFSSVVQVVLFGASIKRELIGVGISLAVVALVSLCLFGWRRSSIRLEWNGSALVVVQDAARAKWRRRAWGRDEISDITVTPWLRRLGVIAVKLTDGRRLTFQTGYPLAGLREAIGLLRDELGLPDERRAA